MRFLPVPRGVSLPSEGSNTVYLQVDHWNDFAFVTLMYVRIFDEHGSMHDLGTVKIGFQGQTEETDTYTTLAPSFNDLGSTYFSVGTDLEYYQKLMSDVSEAFRQDYLSALRDVAYNDGSLKIARDEKVFRTSLLRTLSINTITDQFRRILEGGVPLTDYSFRFTQDAMERLAGYQLDFKVNAGSTPPTNIHAIIGRNGVGKTTLLNNMTRAVMDKDYNAGRFEVFELWAHQPIRNGYFSGIVTVSFSAFDPFNPPEEQPDRSKGTCYFYVGLKSFADESGALLKSQNDLADELVTALGICLSERSRAARWLEAIKLLESDDNFAEMNLSVLADFRDVALEQQTRGKLRQMSSGHTIVLLIITKLVATVDEKTLVLFDEPESHLHPPLLSALIRCLSMLLSSRNAVAIIATHSPVVLQEVPKSCVWKITRAGLSSSCIRPESETFAENVGVLTKAVFGLEVSKSGFNALLSDEAARALTYEDVVEVFGGQLGLEGRAILRSIMHRSQQQ
ncbi:AAA family ATPase [Rhizobium sp. CFBP 8752]|nr:AAA family ATPase [Rhizobium sp. CFBP 8752]